MARLTFRQGIIRHGRSPGQSFFLQQNGQFVDLLISPEQTIIAFADGTTDYLFTESVTNNQLWGPFTLTGQDYWLYWDIDRITGVHTHGHTTLTPVYGTTAPATPVNGQMWFNTSAMKMYEYNGASWVQVLRVFACKYRNNQFFSPVDGVSIETNFTGTQVGSAGNVTKNIGSLVFDASGNPIVNQSGQFFTTEDAFTTGIPTGASLKVNNILIRARATQNIAAYQVVVFTQYNKIKRAAPFDFLDKVYGIVEEDISTNASGNVIMEGIIYNQSWDFSDSINFPDMSGSINDPIYITSSGTLTTNIALAIPGQVPLGAIIGQQSIIFNPGIYGYGTGGASGDHGSLTGLGDDDHTQYHNDTRGDARYYTQSIADILFAPIVHAHTKADIADFSHTHIEADISNLDKYTQAQTNALLNAKVSKSGDTMTGALTLPSDPTSALQAATKQYVDAIAAGIAAKDSVAVATTTDLNATYSATGGTGGTGEFTGVDITNLDGALDVAYDFILTSRVLVKNQTDAKQNGIYIITDQSNPLLATLERAPDHDGAPAAEVSPGNFTFISGGTEHGGSGWVILAGTATGPSDIIILNTDDMNWGQISSATAYTAGNNINITGANVINVKDVIDGGTIDALTWNGHSVTVSGSPLPADNQVLLFNSSTTDWENDYLPLIRNSDNSSNVTINTTTGAIGVLTPSTLSLNSAGNTTITSSLAFSTNSTGNTTFTAGTSSILLNNTSDITLTSDKVIINPTGNNGIVVLNSNGFTSTLTTPLLSGNTQFVLPGNTGSSGQVLSTDGTGVTSWITSSGGGSAYCIKDGDGDTFVSVGFGASPTCTDSGSNHIRIQAGDPPAYDTEGGNVVIRSGLGNNLASGTITLEAAPGEGGAYRGGDINIRSGSGDGKDGGSIRIESGDVVGYGNSAGHVYVYAGDGGGGTMNTAGNVIIQGGSLYAPDYGYNGGNVHLRTAYGNMITGDIYLAPGAAGGETYGGQGSIIVQRFGSGGSENPDLRFYNKTLDGFAAIIGPIGPIDDGNFEGYQLELPRYSALLNGQILAVNDIIERIPDVFTHKLEFVDVPYDLAGQGYGALSDGDVILRFIANRSFVLLSDSHRGYADTAPTGTDAVFTVERKTCAACSPTTLGTITFTAGNQTPTFSGFSDTIISEAHIVTITCTTASAIEDVAITLGGRIGNDILPPPPEL